LTRIASLGKTGRGYNVSRKRIKLSNDKPSVHLALLHYPVYNKVKEVIASAVTNLDIHDIARCAKTYGLKKYYLVTPLYEQEILVKKIIKHWTDGYGAGYNSDRKRALELVDIKKDLAACIFDIEKKYGAKPKIIVTAAKKYDKSISYSSLKSEIFKDGTPFLILFGTGWGLERSIIEDADYVLEPISGGTDYNHLSVRSAAAIILDRLFA
jgi:hypothetical protein